MLKSKFDKNGELILKRNRLRNAQIDIEGRDIVIGFNEPSLKLEHKNFEEPTLDSKLNARLVSYFLPAVQIAKMQKKRPRLFIVSGLNMALKWSASSEKDKKIMMIDNNLKFDFLRKFFERFFPDTFSVIEFIVAQDPLKIPEERLLGVWRIIERQNPKEAKKIKFALARFRKPRLFNTPHLSEKAKEFLESQDRDLINALKYAISHLFALADINFEGNYIHNPKGYLTIGGEQEKIFNKVRRLAFDTLKDFGEVIFGRKIIIKDNLKLVVVGESLVPPPYNGFYRSRGKNHLELDEVTYENKRDLDFYETHLRLKHDFSYILSLIDSEKYEVFWNLYEKRYFDLKARYREAYGLEEDF